jgi:hypothetical protein
MSEKSHLEVLLKRFQLRAEMSQIVENQALLNKDYREADCAKRRCELWNAAAESVKQEIEEMTNETNQMKGTK